MAIKSTQHYVILHFLMNILKALIVTISTQFHYTCFLNISSNICLGLAPISTVVI
jgi:hypothetical protein